MPMTKASAAAIAPEAASASASADLLYFPPQPPPPAIPVSAAAAAPIGAIPSPRIASSLPDTMAPPDTPYSLLEDMRQAAAAAAGPKEKVSLYGFPSYAATNIRRVLARSRNGRGDWSLALSCLLWQGLTRYAALPAVRDLSSALQALDTDDGLGTLAGEQVEMWRRGFRFSIADPTHTMGLERVRSWKAPEHVHTELYDLSGRLGLSGSALGVASVLSALSDQDGVLPEHRGYMEAVVEELDTLLVERGRRLRKLVRAIEAGVWEP